MKMDKEDALRRAAQGDQPDRRTVDDSGPQRGRLAAAQPFLPPAPPLTPPELSAAVFPFAPDHQPPHAMDGFIRQPNPDYNYNYNPCNTAAASSPATPPRRLSYHRVLGISPLAGGSRAADADFAPSSYPPSSPLLPPPPPPPPPPPAAPADDQARRRVDVKGEIISALDGQGAGWTRHTRVYGGGVCLACAASGAEHGGFYGATVTPEEMRHGAVSVQS
ncbi:hypothetical protein UVI_02045910 [Ustilaginoidea virens]|nr:hypothetical protein UVI_02045910 [Ustilaginoidea virens]